MRAHSEPGIGARHFGRQSGAFLGGYRDGYETRVARWRCRRRFPTDLVFKLQQKDFGEHDYHLVVEEVPYLSLARWFGFIKLSQMTEFVGCCCKIFLTLDMTTR